MLKFITTLNVLKTVLFFATLLLFGNAEAIPGESFQKTKEQFESNEIFQGVKLRIDPLSEMVGYNLTSFIPTPVLTYTTFSPQEFRLPEFQGIPFLYYVCFDEREIVLLETFLVQGEAQLGNLSSDSYDPRQDSLILNLLESVWNTDVSSDFSQARFTDSFGTGRGSIRRLYRGETFGYQLSSGIDSRYFNIQIFPVRFADNYSVPSDYETRF